MYCGNCASAACLLQVLLPFTFNQGAIDAISGTQPQQTAAQPQTVQASASPAGVQPGGRRLLMQIVKT
jgi:hypothetical protein